MQCEDLKKEACLLLWERGWAVEEISLTLSKSKKWVVSTRVKNRKKE